MSLRVYSAVQASGRLHVGNWLGALRQWEALQHGPHSLVFAVADLHALTAGAERCAAAETMRGLLACGLNPDRAVLYRQSDLAGPHAALMWLLACCTPTPLLQRMVHYKDKSARANDTLGLLGYPVLQAADILLFGAELVPVGEDQRQHLELARDVVTAFNTHWQTNLFRPPRALISEACRVMSLRDPSRKMSKSDPRGVLYLDDEPDVIRSKIAKAVTDSEAGVVFQPENRPALASLIRLYAAVDGTEPTAVVFNQKSDFKIALADLAIASLQPIRANLAQISLHDAEVAMKAGAERARAIAEPTLEAAMKACKLRD